MIDRVKVLVVIGELEVGGTERQLLNVSREINSDDIEVVVYALRGDGSLIESFLAAGIRVIYPPGHSRRWLGLLRTAAHLVRTFRSERPRILHFFLPEAYLIGGLCSLLGPSCVRIMSRRSLNYYQRRWFGIRSIERILHHRMDGILANSRAVLSDLKNEGVPDHISGVVCNGVSVPPNIDETAIAALRLELSLNPTGIVLIVVANLIPYKGHSDVFDALVCARDSLGDSWTLLLVGADHGIEIGLKQRAKDAGIEANIRWLGRQSDVYPYLAVSDIAVLASHEEGFSNAILEAMAMQLPVIATAVGGNLEAVLDGKTGILVPPENPKVLAAAIIRLANEVNLRQEMGKAGQKRVLHFFAIEQCADAHRRLYLDLAHGRRTPIRSLVGIGP
mgnify:CR=1 FL=1